MCICMWESMVQLIVLRSEFYYIRYQLSRFDGIGGAPFEEPWLWEGFLGSLSQRSLWLSWLNFRRPVISYAKYVNSKRIEENWRGSTISISIISFLIHYLYFYFYFILPKQGVPASGPRHHLCGRAAGGKPGLSVRDCVLCGGVFFPLFGLALDIPVLQPFTQGNISIATRCTISLSWMWWIVSSCIE